MNAHMKAHSGKTLFDKLWESHVIESYEDGWALLHVDRLLLHDLTAAGAFKELADRQLTPADSELVFATPDHAISSLPGRTGDSSTVGRLLYRGLLAGAAAAGVRTFDVGSGEQGIVHVIGPELGIVLPGLSIACGDSHTCTNGAMGTLAIGIGSSEGAHALATQTLRLQKPKNMRIWLEGRRSSGVSAKDIALHLIQTLGVSAGLSHAVEYAGPVIEEMDIEERLTVCNMAIETGARFGIMAPDERTIGYVRGRKYAPTGMQFEQAARAWRALQSDPSAAFDIDRSIDVSLVVPVITWGTNPEQAIAVSASLPQLDSFDNASCRQAAAAAYEYMGLEPGAPIAGTPVDWVFIGSCNGGRLSDLQAAAKIVQGKQVAPTVSAWVVPGSEAVKQQAEAAGLDAIFLAAGFEWREPGCSLCGASNGDHVPPGARCVSTSNRNFIGRQGPRARTHLASAQMAAASAIAGAIVDPRGF